MRLGGLDFGMAVGRYVLGRRVTVHRFGQVWRVRPADSPDVPETPRVALTVLTDPQYLKNLRADRRPLLGFRHPNVAGLLEWGLDDVHPHAACEWVEGTPLRNRLKEGPLPPAEALGVLRQILAGLSAAHAAGLTHRNLTPDKVVLTPDGRAVVIDLPFGEAVEETTSQMCMSGIDWSEFAEFWRYLAPEQEAGLNGSAASDVYSAALVFYEMLTGFLPPAVLRKGTLPDLPDWARGFVARAMAPVGERYPDAAAFLAGLPQP
jgi:serine/threonine protein kinase